MEKRKREIEFIDLVEYVRVLGELKETDYRVHMELKSAIEEIEERIRNDK